MFNNVGIFGVQYVCFLDDDLLDFNKVVGINLFGVMVGSSSVGKYMFKNGGGVIINNVFIVGLFLGQVLMIYCVIKVVMIMFSKFLVIDLVEYGICVNCFVFGYICISLMAFFMLGMIEE